ncbi:hypothetical protein U1Q18_037743, partial [Sarracenia purpurea var. burkii]
MNQARGEGGRRVSWHRSTVCVPPLSLTKVKRNLVELRFVTEATLLFEAKVRGSLALVEEMQWEQLGSLIEPPVV